MPSAPFLGMPFKWRWDMVRQRHSAVGGTKRLGIVAVWNRLQCINRQAGTLPRQFENFWELMANSFTAPNMTKPNQPKQMPEMTKEPGTTKTTPPSCGPSFTRNQHVHVQTNKIMEPHSFFRYTLEKWLLYFLRVHECLVKLSIWTLNKATTPQKWSSFISAWLCFHGCGSNLGNPKVLDGECYTMTRICGFLLINHMDGYMQRKNICVCIYIIIYILSKYQIVADISHYISLCPYLPWLLVIPPCLLLKPELNHLPSLKPGHLLNDLHLVSKDWLPRNSSKLTGDDTRNAGVT